MKFLKFFLNIITKNVFAAWVVFFSIFFIWIAYNTGQIVALSDNNYEKLNINEKISLVSFEKLLSEKKGGKLIIGSTVKYIDTQNHVYWIDDFQEKISRADLDYIRSNNVDIKGGVKLQLINSDSSVGAVLVQTLLSLVGQVFFIVFYILLGLLLFSQVRSGNLLSKKFNRINKNNKNVAKISDIAGHEGPKKELLEIVDYLKAPEKYIKTGARPPSGILLYGPPGNGKTLLAKAVAGEANANFLEQNASSFVQLYVGAGAMSVRGLFKEARKLKPCVIFIDEIDSVATSREKIGGNSEKEQTINALLAELDGFIGREGVVVIAATNRLEQLDEAIIRPGRFDRKVYIPLPSKNDRLEILNLHAKKIPKLKTDLREWAEQTKGFSGADLANLVNEAAIEASREGVEEVNVKHFAKARDRVMLGARNHGQQANARDKNFVAYHELGHAITQMKANNKKVEKISILARGLSLGVTITQADEEEQLLQTKEQIKNDLIVLMGGRAAEEIFCGAVTGGAADDMQKASRIAREAIRRLGFDMHGPYIPEHEALLKEIEMKAAEWVKEAYEEAKKVLSFHKQKIEKAAIILIKNDEMSGSELEAIMNSK